ncbi:uncharacterized protein LOC105840780 [Monomorium pharaonis]|uniref:uncharacterized protein LOC105840780 n=1 Tax=Monomorium pharaonis TaxID=307658 RepID=UPI00063F6F96|nr:uncharacterized protein LOC105840780 [Monomorium pharaonis]XP_036141287.1 uncharacterized protein LOC105840780 [Monomorium pharaonis]XP_036141289.1 uncharacterized protein LOC105840780 [Monomorium pharaonis]
MSHTVTIRTQTVTSSSSTIVLNTGYLKTWSGILKLLQVALGIVCVGIVGHEFSNVYRSTADLFFLLITTTFMIGSFILLLSCLTSFSTASIMAKTIHEIIYHSIAFGLLLAASLTLMVHINNYRRYNYELLLGASICGLVNAGLYLFSTIIALRTYRGI